MLLGRTSSTTSLVKIYSRGVDSLFQRGHLGSLSPPVGTVGEPAQKQGEVNMLVEACYGEDKLRAEKCSINDDSRKESRMLDLMRKLLKCIQLHVTKFTFKGNSIPLTCPITYPTTLTSTQGQKQVWPKFSQYWPVSKRNLYMPREKASLPISSEQRPSSSVVLKGNGSIMESHTSQFNYECQQSL